LSDRNHGLRLVIGIKTGFSPEAVLEQLYRHTPLEDGFSINNVALVGGGPQTLGLLDLLRVYIAHRVEVVTRRSRFRLARRKERLHLVEGLLIAILDIDEVIQVIRTSDDTDQARTRLCEVFDLSTLQADYILELRLRRLTRFSRIELETERDRLRAEIAELERLLASPELIDEAVSDELEEVASRFGTPRRTLLTMARPSIATAGSRGRQPVQLEVADAPCRLFLSTTGRIVRVDLEPGEDGAPARITPPARRSKHDAVLSSIETTSRAEIGAVTSRGRLVRFSPVDLPGVPANSIQLAAGVKIGEYLALADRTERVLALVPLIGETSVALGTRQGTVKRVTPGDITGAKPELDLIALKPGDEVIGATLAEDTDELVFVASDSQLLRFPASSVRPQGRGAGGMAGIKLAEGARAIFFSRVTADEADSAIVATVATSALTLAGADPGSAKVSAFAEFPAKGRATGGVRSQRFLKGESELSVAWVGPEPARALGPDGAARPLPAAGARRDASGAPLDSVIGSIGRQPA
jgi:DNA gyrase subunit A